MISERGRVTSGTGVDKRKFKTVIKKKKKWPRKLAVCQTLF